MFYCSLSQEVSTLIATIIGGAIGGICTFLGSTWAMSKQIKAQNKNEKNKILLDYYNLLSKYYNLINAMFNKRGDLGDRIRKYPIMVFSIGLE